MLRNVYFEGEMGDRFIPSLQMNCETASQALQCLGANFDDFIPWLIENCLLYTSDAADDS